MKDSQSRGAFLFNYQTIFTFTLLAPERKNEITIPSTNFLLAKERFEEVEMLFEDSDPKAYKIARYIIQAGCVAALDPRYQKDPFVNKDIINKTKDVFTKLAEEKEWEDFLGLAVGLMMCTAKQVTIPNPGNIEFVLPQKKIASKPELPPQNEY